MPTRQFNGPAGGEYVTDQYGNCLPFITSPITDDYDLAGQIASQDARVTAMGVMQQRGLVSPNVGSIARLAMPRALVSGELPTFTAGIASAASAISDGVDIDDESPVFRRHGSPVAPAGAGYSWIGQAISNGTINVGAHWGVEFEWYGAAFELRLRGSTTARFRMWVNGLGYDEYEGRSGSMSSDGLLYRHHYDFETAESRRIRLEFNGSVQFFGLTIGPNDSIWPPSSPPGPKVIATGDSFTEQFTHWPIYAGWLLGWSDIAIVGKGSTGYLDTNAGSDTMRDRAQKDIYNQDPDIVLVHAGLNDTSAYSAAQVLAECNVLFPQIKSNTDAALIVIGFNRSRGLNGDASWIQMRDAIREAAESHADCYVETVGGPYPYSGTFSDYNTTGWLTGSGRVGATTGSGNCDLFVGADNTHPTVAGQVYRGLRVAQGIAAAMPILGGS